MGTISDKLMRVINTKEDIRQALISKGYDVPTSIPFKEYAKMISDLPCKVDDFPKLPGDVTRWHFGGLTNEMMAAMDDPRIEDADHKGRFLSFKNFAWSGMSGVGGYVQDFNYFRNNATVDKIRIDEQGSNSIKVTILTTGIGNAIYIPRNIYQFNKSYFIKISSEGYNEGDLSLSFYASSTSTATAVRVPLNPNGITEIPAIKEDDFLAVYITVGGKVGSITIEQLPIYPGALVFDGVDDYGVCDNFPILTKEKGYTVVALRQYITRNEGPLGLVSNIENWFKYGAFLLEFREIAVSQFNRPISFGAVGKERDLPCVLTYQTSKSYNGVSIEAGNFTGTDVLHVGKLSPKLAGYCNAAIWELVFLDHDATEEELTKIKDYFVKTYPWLFPDQAWTVAGKTNEDKDRATIANITGNGNNLVLSNFGFAEGSGYGLYYQYFGNEFKATNGEIEGGGWNIIDNYNISHDKRIPINSIGKCFWGNKALVNGIKLRFKLTGMTEGDVLAFGYAATYDLTYTSDGIYAIDLPPVDKPYGFSLQSSLTENLPTTPVTIELLPFEYEGYLVTDGVDDKAVSKQFKFGENFTVILDFKFPVKKISYCGFDLSSKVRIQNLQGSGVYVVLKGNKTLIPSNVVRAVTSEGKVYDENWNEYNIVPGNISSNYTMVNLGFDGSNQFAESATKLAGIYSSALSKDDCIKAYNYLQTLKSK